MMPSGVGTLRSQLSRLIDLAPQRPSRAVGDFRERSWSLYDVLSAQDPWKLDCGTSRRWLRINGSQRPAGCVFPGPESQATLQGFISMRSCLT